MNGRLVVSVAEYKDRGWYVCVGIEDVLNRHEPMEALVSLEQLPLLFDLLLDAKRVITDARAAGPADT